MNQIKNIFSYLKKQKWKIIFLFNSILLFAFLIFPFNDLSDYLTIKVSEMTQNQVYLQFDEIKAGFGGIAVTNVNVETPKFPAIQATEISASPSLAAIIKKQPGGTVRAKGIFQGDAMIRLTPGKKSEKGVEQKDLSLVLKNISLQHLKDFLKLPVNIKGKVDLSSNGLIDFNWEEQPELEFSSQLNSVQILATQFDTMMGPLSFSGLKISQIEMKGRWASGRVLLEEGKLGNPSDEISGSVKGLLNIQMLPGGAPQFGAYQLELDLTVKKSFLEKEKLLGVMLESYKTPGTADSERFKLKLSGNDFYSPPSINALR